MQLEQLFPIEAFEEHVADGLVRVQRHEHVPLAVANYTERAVFNRVWDEVTTQCRGLIWNTATGQVVARPFDKFFNLGEVKVDESSWNSYATVTDKLDGSLGIMYQLPSIGGYLPQYAIATRGSFISDQAVHATLKLQEYLAAGFVPAKGVTYLFEIIYAENRVVLNYGDMDDLVLLGGRDVEEGFTVPPNGWFMQTWPGPTVEIMSYSTMREAFEAPPRPNKEGVVVHIVDQDRRVKIKQADYVELHRVITGMNERRVWELLSSGVKVDDICSTVPEEFWPWIQATSGKLFFEYTKVYRAAQIMFANIRSELTERYGEWTRADFARMATREAEVPGMMFSLLDGKDISPQIWKMIKPAAGRPLVTQTEDSA